MGSSAYIGRVGGLAVALGVGTAIATGHGIAAAAPGDSSAGSSAKDSTTSSAGSESTSGSGDKTGSGDTQTDTKPDGASQTDTITDPGKPDKPSTVKPRPSLRTADKKPFSPRRAGRPAASTAVPETKATAPAATAPVTTTAPLAAEPVRAEDPTDTLQSADKVAVFASAAALASATATQVERRVTPIAAAPHPLTPVVKVVAKVLDWAAGAVPGSPASPTLAWTLLAFARREVDNLLTRMNPSSAVSTGGVATDTISRALAAVNPRPGFPWPGAQLSGSTTFVDWVTGNFPPNDTFNRYGIWGTDIGTMWDNGIPDDPATPINENQVLIAFGDTFGGPNMTGTWRLNTLFRSPDRDLSNGMAVPGGQWFNGNMFGGSPLWEPTYARQIILSRSDCRAACRPG